jgi:hypothetical protein
MSDLLRVLMQGMADVAEPARLDMIERKPMGTHDEDTQEREPAFRQFVTEQQQKAAGEAAEIDQRAAASAIIAEDAADLAAQTRPDGKEGPNILELLGSILKYLDYQRAELTIRKPDGDSGDILWLVNKTLSNAGVSPERSLVAAVQLLGQYMVDLYAQNAKIRKRLTRIEQEAACDRGVTEELVACVAQFEEIMAPYDLFTRLNVSPAMRERIEAAKEQLERAEEARREESNGEQ